MNKKTFLFGLLSALSVAVATGVVISPTSATGTSASEHTSSCVIHHYQKISPSFTSNGVKEYWICCTHYQSGPEFVQPTSGKIVESIHPDGFASTVNKTDSRYLSAYSKSVDFEDGLMPTFLSMKTGSASISDETASKGNYSLKITGAFRLKFDPDYLTALFDQCDGDDNAILFDLKGTEYRNDLYYSSIDEQYGVHRYDSIMNIGNDGIRTSWKTFAFTKDDLSHLSNGEVIRTDSGNGTVYLDHIRLGKAYSKDSLISFEDDSVYNHNAIPLSASWNEEVKVTNETSADMTVSISDNYASEGHNSLHISTTAATKVNVFINKAMYDKASAGFLFDLYTPSDAAITNIKNRYKSSGNNVFYTPLNYTVKGKWITYFVPKSAVYDGDYMLFRCDNSIVTDFYIDNIRLADADIGFENGEISSFGENRNGYTPYYDGNYCFSGSSLGAKNGSDIWFNTGINASISDEQSTDGAYSLKTVCTEKNTGFYLSDRLYNLLPDDGLQLDVYVNKAVNFFSAVSGQSGVHDWTPGEWVTLTVPKSYIGRNTSTNEWVLFLFGDTVTAYFDHIRIAPETVTLNGDVISQTGYDWYN